MTGSHQEEADYNDICIQIVDIQAFVDYHDHQGDNVEYGRCLAFEHLDLGHERFGS